MQQMRHACQCDGARNRRFIASRSCVPTLVPELWTRSGRSKAHTLPKLWLAVTAMIANNIAKLGTGEIVETNAGLRRQEVLSLPQVLAELLRRNKINAKFIEGVENKHLPADPKAVRDNTDEQEPAGGQTRQISERS